jgi:hypothetical protein
MISIDRTDKALRRRGIDEDDGGPGIRLRPMLRLRLGENNATGTSNAFMSRSRVYGYYLDFSLIGHTHQIPPIIGLVYRAAKPRNTPAHVKWFSQCRPVDGEAHTEKG